MTYIMITILFMVSVILVQQLRLKAIVIVVLAGFLQNFILPLLLTVHIMNVAAVTACLYFKDILCALLTLYAIRVIYTSRKPIRLSVLVLALFTAWCVFRGMTGLTLLSERLLPAGRWLRDIFGPLEFTCIGVALAQQPFARSMLRRYVMLLGIIAIVALVLAGPVGTLVWGKYVNIASYNEQVKHEAANTQSDTLGVSGNGTLNSRGAFVNIVGFRAMGTFGDPLSMAINMAFALGLVCLVFEKKSWMLLIMISLALFFSLSRSGWIFFVVVSLYVLARMKRARSLISFASLLIVCIVAIAPLRDFLLTTVDTFSTNADPHATGVKAIYTTLWERQGIGIGNGFKYDYYDPRLPESGYGSLLIIFGVPGLILFLLFCLTAFIDLQRPIRLAVFMQGVMIATIVVMNFSYYPFGFNPYIVIWLVFGATISGYEPECVREIDPPSLRLLFPRPSSCC